MRKTYTMTTAQRDTLLASMTPVPYMIVGGFEPRSRQENANEAWKALGREMGFDGMTVQPGRTALEFTAEEVAAAPPKEQQLRESDNQTMWEAGEGRE